VILRIAPADCALAPASPIPPHGHIVDMGRFHAIATLLNGVVNSRRIHAVNAPHLAALDARQFIE
jgi:hypothetical protein